MECPRCRLISPDSAARCDCGYDFGAGSVQQSYLVQEFYSRHPDPAAWFRECGRRDLRTAAVCLLAGFGVALGSYALDLFSPHARGVFILVVSPFVYGLLMLARGVRHLRVARRGAGAAMFQLSPRELHHMPVQGLLISSCLGGFVGVGAGLWLFGAERFQNSNAVLIGPFAVGTVLGLVAGWRILAPHRKPAGQS
jgi:hypothetical protein